MLTASNCITCVIRAHIAVITVKGCSCLAFHASACLSARAYIAVRAVAVRIALAARYWRIHTARSRIACVIRASVTIIAAYWSARLTRRTGAVVT